MDFYPASETLTVRGRMLPVVISQDRCFEPFRDCLYNNMFSFLHRSMKELPALGKEHVVFFEGGTDVNPALYNSAKIPASDTPDVVRDAFEQRVFEHAYSCGSAMVGICRGAQFLNVMCGGEMYQDVSKHARAGTHKITD